MSAAQLCNGVQRNGTRRRRCLSAGVWYSPNYVGMVFCDEHKTSCCRMRRVVINRPAATSAHVMDDSKLPRGVA